jgi:RNA polymerase sigma-70 factor (ECF subfamily)
MTNSIPVDVVAHLDSLRRYARALTRDEAAADDLVQESLLRAIERAGTYRPGGSLRAWLAGIVHNRFVSGRRRQAAEARRNETLAGIRGEAVLDGEQEHAAQLALVAARFDALPDQQRAVLHLVAVEGLSYQEAATALDVPIGTVMSRLSRARAALRAAETPIPKLRMVRNERDD